MNNTKLIVRDFILPARIGVYEEEKHKTQNICINITLDLGDFHVAKDDVLETIDYASIIKEIRQMVTVHRNLVEVLVEDILQFVMKDARVREATVQIEKLEIVPDARVGCIMTRQR